jgi:hypothetical protein
MQGSAGCDPLPRFGHQKTPDGTPRGLFGAGEPASFPVASESAFALSLFPRQFTGTANGFSFLARFLDGRLLEMLLKLHFTKHTLALKFFLQSPKRLFDVVVANADLHVVVTTFLSLSCVRLQEVAL